MTLTFTTNSNNDIFIGDDGNLSISRGIDGVAKACETAVKAQLGEMMFAVDQGMPNFQVVWNGRPNVIQFEAYLRQTIMGVDGVTGINNIDTSIVGDILVYSAVITTIYGQVNING